MSDVDEAEFLAWKAEKDERARKRGDYWVSPEGRADIRDIWGYDSDDGSTVTPLMNALEATEAKLSDAIARIAELEAQARPLEWTSEPPKEPGWYFFLYSKGGGSYHTSLLFYPDRYHSEADSSGGGKRLWSGPIPEPRDPEGGRDE